MRTQINVSIMIVAKAGECLRLLSFQLFLNSFWRVNNVRVGGQAFQKYSIFDMLRFDFAVADDETTQIF